MKYFGYYTLGVLPPTPMVGENTLLIGGGRHKTAALVITSLKSHMDCDGWVQYRLSHNYVINYVISSFCQNFKLVLVMPYLAIHLSLARIVSYWAMLIIGFFYLKLAVLRMTHDGSSLKIHSSALVHQCTKSRRARRALLMLSNGIGISKLAVSHALRTSIATVFVYPASGLNVPARMLYFYTLKLILSLDYFNGYLLLARLSSLLLLPFNLWSMAWKKSGLVSRKLDDRCKFAVIDLAKFFASWSRTCPLFAGFSPTTLWEVLIKVDASTDFGMGGFSCPSFNWMIYAWNPEDSAEALAHSVSPIRESTTFFELLGILKILTYLAPILRGKRVQI